MTGLSVALACMLSAATGNLSVEQIGSTVTVTGSHFAVTVDASKGGEITSIQLHDGAAWTETLQDTFPALAFSDAESTWALALDPRKGVIKQVEVVGDKVRILTHGVLRRADGTGSPWGVDLLYEIYPEGAVFVDMQCRLVEVPFALAEASVSFQVSDALRGLEKYRAQQTALQDSPHKSFRAAFGADSARAYTNELEVIVEDKTPLSGTSDCTLEDHGATWRLGVGGDPLEPGFTYRNRFALGLGAAATGKPRTNVIGQRVYHVVNWLDLDNWYPSNEEIDAMVANNASMLILHHEWMLQRGSNGYPHAEYHIVRDHDAFVRMMDYAHAKGLRVGLYMRGVEPYALDTGFFQKYCKRNWDGIYCDWHGPFGVAWHENLYKPEPFLGDRHYSENGTYAPAHAYFLMTRRMREIVGPDGFLIGHQGVFNSGVFANLCFDAFLPGESGSDRDMFASLDEAAYKGMLGGGVPMPWTLDLPKYRNAEGAAKMAVWGFYPHIVMGIKARRGEELTFTNDPNDPEYQFVLPYWRLLAQIDVEKCRVFNLPSVNVDAIATSNADVNVIAYKEESGRCLMIAGNLAESEAQSVITPDPAALGLTRACSLQRIDADTGEKHPHEYSDGSFATSTLPQWGIEGYLFTPE